MAAPVGSGSDPQQLLVRRLVAAGIGVVVVIVLVLGVKGCLNSRKEQALKDYNRDVASLVQDVDANTEAFFAALTTGGTSAIDVQSQINQLRLRAQSQTREAQSLGLPGEMKPAQRSLLLALGLIEESMGKVAEKIRAALSTDSATAEPAVVATTAELQAFLAADVLYKRRTVAFIEQALGDHGIRGQKVQDASFLPNVGWLDAPTVARRIHADAAHGAGSDASATPPAPGTHGHGLLAVNVGDVTLEPGGANRIPAGSDVTFNVKFANQGENPEADVRVRIVVRGGGKTIVAQKTVDETTPGNETTAAVALGQPPPLGPGVNITVEVRKVPGETNVANNSQQYPAIFAP